MTHGMCTAAIPGCYFANDPQHDPDHVCAECRRTLDEVERDDARYGADLEFGPHMRLSGGVLTRAVVELFDGELVEA